MTEHQGRVADQHARAAGSPARGQVTGPNWVLDVAHVTAGCVAVAGMWLTWERSGNRSSFALLGTLDRLGFLESVPLASVFTAIWPVLPFLYVVAMFDTVNARLISRANRTTDARWTLGRKAGAGLGLLCSAVTGLVAAAAVRAPGTTTIGPVVCLIGAAAFIAATVTDVVTHSRRHTLPTSHTPDVTRNLT